MTPARTTTVERGYGGIGTAPRKGPPRYPVSLRAPSEIHAAWRAAQGRRTLIAGAAEAWGAGGPVLAVCGSLLVFEALFGALVGVLADCSAREPRTMPASPAPAPT